MDCDQCIMSPYCTRKTINRIDNYCWLYDEYENEDLEVAIRNRFALIGKMDTYRELRKDVMYCVISTPKESNVMNLNTDIMSCHPTYEDAYAYIEKYRDDGRDYAIYRRDTGRIVYED